MLLSWGQCCISIIDEVMSDLSDLLLDTARVLSSVLSDTPILLSSSSAPVHARVRACADDDDEIILGIIALVVVKAE